MARKTRWAVRDGGPATFAAMSSSNMYRIYVGAKPRKNIKGEWPNSALERWVRWLRADLFEEQYPVRLKPGGGPVEIGFADEE